MTAERVRLAAALLLATAATATPAQDSYLQYGHMDAKVDSGHVHGETAQLYFSPGGDWLFRVGASALDAHDHDPLMESSARIESGYAGFGVRNANGPTEFNFLLAYLGERSKGAGIEDEYESGVAVIAGLRWRPRPWMSFEPEIGGTLGGLEGLDYFARAQVAIRLVPHVWLFGGYQTSLISRDTRGSTAGLRFTFGEKAPAPPATRLLDAGVDAGPAELAVGQERVSVRDQLLQKRPAFGAPETATLPAGTPLKLLRTLENEFGTWWLVSDGQQQGWIRESRLK